MFQKLRRICFCALLVTMTFRHYAKADSQSFHHDLKTAAAKGVQVRYEKFDERGVFIEKSYVQVLPSQQRPNRTAQHKIISANSEDTSKNKINLVIIGDGYTKNEMSLYRKQVDEKVNELFAQEPLKEYKNYFNVIIIESESDTSGIADSEADSGRTAFGMYFNCGGLERLICIDLNKVAVAVKDLPKVDMIFALANTEKYGGAGYLKPAIATLSAGHKLSTELALHEFGHSFAKLTDEYEDEDHSTDCDNYANASSIDSHQMKAEKKKWFSWLHLNHVGTFSGGCYNKKIFRPTDVSKMRSLKHPFYEVNSEQIVKQIYKKTNVVTSAELTSDMDGHFEIQINHLQNDSNSVKIKWFADELELEQFENLNRIKLRSLNFNRENLIVTAIVQDETPQLRDEEFRATNMTRKMQWEINLPRPTKNQNRASN